MKWLHKLKGYFTRNVKYSITGNGVINVRASDWMKTEKAKSILAYHQELIDHQLQKDESNG